MDIEIGGETLTKKPNVLEEIHYDYLFVDEESFNKYKLKNFKVLMSGFRDYKALK